MRRPSNGFAGSAEGGSVAVGAGGRVGEGGAGGWVAGRVSAGAAVPVGGGTVPAGVGDAGTGSVRQPDNSEVSRTSRQMPAGIRRRVRCMVVGVL